MDPVRRGEIAQRLSVALEETNQKKDGPQVDRLTGPEAMAYEKIGNSIRSLVDSLNHEKISGSKERLLVKIVREIRKNSSDITDDLKRGEVSTKIEDAAGELYVALNHKENIDPEGNLIEDKLVSKILELGKERFGIAPPDAPSGPSPIDIMRDGL